MDSKSEGQAGAVLAFARGPAMVTHGVHQATLNLIARVNAVALTGEELMLAAAEIQKLSLETCNREARICCLARVFEARRGKAFAVDFRLEAMAKLTAAGKIPGCWAHPAMARDIVFHAAAKEPLLFTADNEPFFEAESFVALLLEITDADGHA